MALARCYLHAVMVILPYKFGANAVEDSCAGLSQHAENLRLTGSTPLLIINRRHSY